MGSRASLAAGHSAGRRARWGSDSPAAARTGYFPRDGYLRHVKKILELLVCILHPLAVVLIWIDLFTRRDTSAGAKLAWAIFSLIPLVPFIYVLTGGDLW